MRHLFTFEYRSIFLFSFLWLLIIVSNNVKIASGLYLQAALTLATDGDRDTGTVTLGPSLPLLNKV